MPSFTIIFKRIYEKILNIPVSENIISSYIKTYFGMLHSPSVWRINQESQSK